ncbi:MAG: SAM-dependent chlorinase/fluorinase [Chloroflexi bacterium]|nr:SAM-dependent chlorinase/fluorinase [Chloroflexota bacterium]MDA1175418.1 SAM-dependent chlorinase/fluorinase [Chloroflexota bacterium]
MQPPIITLTTDFGTADTFVGAMKGVILGIAPDAQVIDLTHEIPPQDVQAGAFTLASVYRYFPPGTIHVAVVDPGVGTRRHPIAVTTDDATFICPDNGLLSYPLDEARAFVDRDPFAMGRVAVPRDWHAVHLSNADYWRQPLSSTFHGRDIFAPIAGHLAAGVAIASLGTRVMDLAAFAVPRPRTAGDTSIGQVLHVDHFGNLITNLHPANFPDGRLRIRVGGTTISGLSDAYQDGGDLVALIGSSGTLEIAFRNGNAARTLGVTVGADVHVISRG